MGFYFSTYVAPVICGKHAGLLNSVTHKQFTHGTFFDQRVFVNKARHGVGGGGGVVGEGRGRNVA